MWEFIGTALFCLQSMEVVTKPFVITALAAKIRNMIE